MADAEIVQHSVTKADYTDDAGKKGAVLHFVIGGVWGQPLLTSLPTTPPPWWSYERDDVLRATIHFDSMWANAVYLAQTKVAALSFQVRGPVALQVKRAQELLLANNWTHSISRHMLDFLLTDNGAFIEVVRSSSSMSSKIIGLVPLDSRRCRRTGDPDIPLLYRDKLNRWHEMKDYQVMCFSDMPDPSETYFGVGHCAAGRAYKAIYKLAALETYVNEKIVGRRPLALHFVNNISQTQIDTAIQSAEQQANQKGYSQYMGAVVVANIDPTSQPGVATIDLAGLPERFEAEQERLNAYLAFADAIGLDPQELDPKLLASKAIGTGGQAKVIDDKASGRGIWAWRKEFEWAMNEWVMGEKVLFYFKERDMRDQLQQAQLEQLRTGTAQVRVESGILDAEMAKQMLADAGDIPMEFLTQDLITTTTLSDDTKLEAIGEPNPEMVEEQEALAQQEQQMQQAQSGMMMAQADAGTSMAKYQAQNPQEALEMQARAGEMQSQLNPAAGGMKGNPNDPQNKKKKKFGTQPGAPQGGNPALQGARTDAFKEYDDLRLEQALRETENA